MIRKRLGLRLSVRWTRTRAMKSIRTRFPDSVRSQIRVHSSAVCNCSERHLVRPRIKPRRRSHRYTWQERSSNLEPLRHLYDNKRIRTTRFFDRLIMTDISPSPSPIPRASRVHETTGLPTPPTTKNRPPRLQVTENQQQISSIARVLTYTRQSSIARTPTETPDIVPDSQPSRSPSPEWNFASDFVPDSQPPLLLSPGWDSGWDIVPDSQPSRPPSPEWDRASNTVPALEPIRKRSLSDGEVRGFVYIFACFLTSLSTFQIDLPTKSCRLQPPHFPLAERDPTANTVPTLQSLGSPSVEWIQDPDWQPVRRPMICSSAI